MMSEHYPKPKIPISPVLSWRSFFSSATISISHITTSQSLPLSSGSAAITMALQQAGIQPGEKVLVPAFHCQSMVEPIIAVMAKPVFYKVKENLEIDFDDIAHKTDDSCKAIIAAHYFGFPQNLKYLRTYCDEKNLILIEDCAHMYFGEVGDQPVAYYGDYATASTRKFFPVFDGGELISHRKDIAHIQLTQPGLPYQLKSIINLIERAIAYGRLRPFGLIFKSLFLIKDVLVRSTKKQSTHTGEIPEKTETNPEFTYIEMLQINKAMSTPSQIIRNKTSMSRIVKQRQKNYSYLLSKLSDLSQARPLHPTVSEEIVPYMFPLLIEQPDKHFPALKNKGIPIWRWEDLTLSDCAVSKNYSQSLLQLPCHQELRSKELDWMIDEIRAVLL